MGNIKGDPQWVIILSLPLYLGVPIRLLYFELLGLSTDGTSEEKL